jgi:hypothetical protein
VLPIKVVANQIFELPTPKRESFISGMLFLSFVRFGWLKKTQKAKAIKAKYS